MNISKGSIFRPQKRVGDFMKKWITGFIVTVIVLIGAIWFYDNCYLPEFEIVNTIKTGSDNFTSVYLTAQINRWFYDEKEMTQKIIVYYCDLNGEQDSIHLKME